MAVIPLTIAMTEQEERTVQNSNNAFLSSTLPIGAILPFGGTVAPSGTMLTTGAAVSRATYSALFDAITFTVAVTSMTSGSATVALDNTSNLFTGEFIEGTGIPSGTAISSITDTTHIVLTKAATATATSGTIRVFPWGNGDGITMFNIPKGDGRTFVGLDLTQTEFNAIGKIGGSKTHTNTIDEMASHNHLLHLATGYDGNSGNFVPYGCDPATYQAWGSGMMQTNGNGQAYSILNPYTVANYIIVYAGGISQAQINAALVEINAAKDEAVTAAVSTAADAAATEADREEVAANTATVNDALTIVQGAADAEINRVNAETSRVDAESSRVTAEQARVTAESARQAEVIAARTSSLKNKTYDTIGVRLDGIDADVKESFTLPTATASGATLLLTDLALHKNFTNITVKGVTTETGTGTKAPDNPYTLSGVTPTKVTVGSTDYPITSSVLYSLPDGTVDFNNAVSGLETHNIGTLTLNGGTADAGFYSSFGWNDLASPAVCYMGTVSSLTTDRTTTCMLCDKLLVNGINPVNDCIEGIQKAGSSTFYVYIDKSRFTYTYGDTRDTVTANLKAYLAANPLHLIYKLATPTTAQHTAQIIPQPSLSTAITPDCGTISVTYYRDLASAINLKADIAQGAWITPTLVNSWVNYDTDSTNELVGYFKDSIGFVHLKGRIKSGTIGSTVFTLPAGYRPSRLKYFAISSNNLFGQVTISAAGLVTCTVGSNASVALENITFRAEA